MIEEEDEESNYNIYDGNFSSDDEVAKELQKQMSPSMLQVPGDEISGTLSYKSSSDVTSVGVHQSQKRSSIGAST